VRLPRRKVNLFLTPTSNPFLCQSQFCSASQKFLSPCPYAFPTYRNLCPAERHSTYHVSYRPVTIYTWPSDGRDLDMNFPLFILWCTTSRSYLVWTYIALFCCSSIVCLNTLSIDHFNYPLSLYPLSLHKY